MDNKRVLEKKIDNYFYTTNDFIGKGSFSIVYKGKHTLTHQPVAVKVIDKKVINSQLALKNIKKQLNILGELNHQNIIKQYNVFQTVNNVYIITEYCNQGNLFNCMNSLSQNDQNTYLKQIIRGIQYLYNKRIFHRDLKLQNILIKNGVCKISDFGFACQFEQNQKFIDYLGSPLYMSLQLLKKQQYTVKSDIWSIGCLIYELLLKEVPFKANNLQKLIKQIQKQKIYFPKGFSQKYKFIIQKCLQIQEKQRMDYKQLFYHMLNQKTTSESTQISKQSKQQDYPIDLKDINKPSYDLPNYQYDNTPNKTIQRANSVIKVNINNQLPFTKNQFQNQTKLKFNDIIKWNTNIPHLNKPYQSLPYINNNNNLGKQKMKNIKNKLIINIFGHKKQDQKQQALKQEQQKFLSIPKIRLLL